MNTTRPSASAHWSSKRRSGFLAAGTAVATACAGAALAQGAAEDQPLEEVIVTAPNYVPTTNLAATKVAIPLVETPQSISVITRDQIDVLNVQNLQQAIRYTSGVIGENYGPDERYDWLTQRGFQPVQYIDGLQAPIGSTNNVGLDLWGAESVEVLKGPSGVLYGQTPPGGLVNITMRRPQKDLHGELQAQYGSFSNEQLAGDITGSLVGDGVLEGRLTGLWRNRDTQTDFVRSTRRYVAPAVTWNFNADGQLTFLSYYQRDEVRGDGGGFLPAAGTILPNASGHIPVNFDAGEPDYNLFRREQYGLGYEFSYNFTDAVSLHQNLKYSRSNAYSQSVYGAGLDATDATQSTLNRFNFIFPEDVRQTAADSRLEVHGAAGGIEHVALFGVDYRRLLNSSDLGFGFGPQLNLFNPIYGQPNPPLFLPTFPYLRQQQKQTGMYAQDQLKFGQWRVTFSGRQDWLKTRDNNSGTEVSDSAFTYRGGVNYLFDSGVAPYFSYSSSFLPVSGADFNGNVFTASTGKQIEAGVKYEPPHGRKDTRMFLSAAVYNLKQDNVLTNDPNHAFFFVQTGEVRVKGIELEGVARIRERVSINGAYTYTDSEVTKSNGPDLGQPLPIVPRHKASLFADYTQQTGAAAGLGGGIGIRYSGVVSGDPANNPTLRSDAVTLVDAILHYNWHDWRLAVNATNLTDKIYIQRCSSFDQCFYASRRTVFVSLGRKW